MSQANLPSASDPLTVLGKLSWQQRMDILSLDSKKTIHAVYSNDKAGNKVYIISDETSTWANGGGELSFEHKGKRNPDDPDLSSLHYSDGDISLRPTTDARNTLMVESRLDLSRWTALRRLGFGNLATTWKECAQEASSSAAAQPDLANSPVTASELLALSSSDEPSHADANAGPMLTVEGVDVPSSHASALLRAETIDDMTRLVAAVLVRKAVLAAKASRAQDSAAGESKLVGDGNA